LISAGRVRLNGAVRRNAETPARPGQDKIEVDGQEIRAAEKAYWMLNKPRGVVTTASDEKGRETVYAYLNEGHGWLAPVGRLDKASEGLLLLTNDSAWAAQVLDPMKHVAKTYHVQIAAFADEPLLEAIRLGVRDGGDLLRVQSVRELRRGERNSWLEVILHEGKNRQIRRSLAFSACCHWRSEPRRPGEGMLPQADCRGEILRRKRTRVRRKLDAKPRVVCMTAEKKRTRCGCKSITEALRCRLHA
jgi:23S rRNA pseudouridine2605 synthase